MGCLFSYAVSKHTDALLGIWREDVCRVKSVVNVEAFSFQGSKWHSMIFFFHTLSFNFSENLILLYATESGIEVVVAKLKAKGNKKEHFFMVGKKNS